MIAFASITLALGQSLLAYRDDARLPENVVFLTSEKSFPFDIDEVCSSSQYQMILTKHNYRVVQSENCAWILASDPCGVEGAKAFASLCSELAGDKNIFSEGISISSLSDNNKRTVFGQLALIASDMNASARKALIGPDVAFSIGVTQNLVLSDGKKTVRLSVPAGGQFPSPAIKPSTLLSQEEKKNEIEDDYLNFLVKQASLSKLDITELSFEYRGRWGLSSRLNESTKLLEYLSKEVSEAHGLMLNARANFSRNILEKKGGFVGDVPAGARYSDLDSSLRKIFDKQLANNYAALGFASYDEAVVFMNAASVRSFSDSLLIFVARETPEGTVVTGGPFGKGIP